MNRMFLAVLPFLGPAGAAYFLWSHYDQLPARFPVHFNAVAQADRWVGKSPGAVFMVPAIAAGSLALMLAILLMIQYSSRPLRGETAVRRHRLNVNMLLVVMWMVSFLTTVAALLPVIPQPIAARLIWASVAGLLLTVAGFAIPLMRMSTEPSEEGDGTPAGCWKLGVFYYNPADPSLMVEKRCGLGYTLNFGNRRSWGLMALMLVIVLAPLFFILRMK
ncbi:MAG TPA: DUF5808 domain-containing protein [Bryobacteraceae bacterium]|nr:DUF5808 domain-containing protein [Bryobacteraceae bacterium]